MRLFRRQKQQSWKWWYVVLFGLLAIGTYVVFDVLDIDGSELASWDLANNLTALESAEPSSCRPPQIVPPERSLPSADDHLSQWLNAQSQQGASSISTGLTRARHAPTLARIRLASELTASNSLSADPA